MLIWLDDERPPPGPKWVWMDNAPAVIRVLSSVVHVVCISLDHDLGDDETYGTGYDVIEWIERRVYMDDNYIPPDLSIHTANPVARTKMLAARDSIRRQLLSR
jgi:hypothetical protein